MSISNTIESYRKRRKQLVPLLIGIVALLLVVIGVVVVVSSLGGGGLTTLFASDTPTPTNTFTPTNTVMPTDTPTITLTPTETPTATPSEPYQYVVQEGDNLYSIVEQKNLGDNGLILIYMLNPGIDPATGLISVGQTITLPPPNYPLPTSTPIPTGLVPGSRITYRVMPGDSFGSIANRFNSTVDAIVLANKATLPDGVDTVIYPGQLLLVPIDLVTPFPTTTPTLEATATP
jgi:LysM repeat protein